MTAIGLIFLLIAVISTSSTAQSPCSKRVVGYITSYGTVPFTDYQAKKLTHLIFAFIILYENGDLQIDSDHEKRRLGQIMTVARRNKHLKVLFSVGSGGNSAHLSKWTSSVQKRKQLIDNIVLRLKESDFDGVDIDWENPVKGQPSGGSPADRENYVCLLREIRIRFDELKQSEGRTYLISFAAPPGQWILKLGYDLRELVKYADFVNVMCYDYYGPWKSDSGALTGPPAPLYTSGLNSVDATMQYCNCQLNASNKINMGVPFYGRLWFNVGDAINPNDDMYRKATAIDGKYDFRGADFPYRTLSEWFDVSRSRFHEEAKTPFAWLPERKTFVGYENPQSLSFKAEYISDKNIGGVMIWAIDMDDDENSLLDALTEGQLCRKSTNPLEFRYKCSAPQNWVSSLRCGPNSPFLNGRPAGCNPDDSHAHCCSTRGYCGNTEAHCKCNGCVDFAKNPDFVWPSVHEQWFTSRDDSSLIGRCGSSVPRLPSGNIAECDPHSEFPCCSDKGFCGNSIDHCNCSGCIDYRS